jgi:hypothetical protein
VKGHADGANFAGVLDSALAVLLENLQMEQRPLCLYVLFMAKAAYDRSAQALKPFSQGGGRDSIIDDITPGRGTFCPTKG